MALAMVLSLFAGMGMDVRAADTIEKTLKTCGKNEAIWTSLGTGVGTGTNCTIKGKNSNSGKDQEFKVNLCYFSGEVSTANLTDIDTIDTFTGTNPPIKIISIPNEVGNYEFTVETKDGISKWDMEGVLIAGEDSGYYLTIFLTPAKNGTSETSSSSAERSDVSHTHSYSWETVQEATIWQDGIEEYRCSCGDVQERSVIPASAAIADGFCNAVGNAPLNGIAEYDSGWWYTMSDYFIRELAKRPDVTTVVTFKYQNQYYKMTIPTGIDYTQLLADEEYFYGYFYFAGLTGAQIEAVE